MKRSLGVTIAAGIVLLGSGLTLLLGLLIAALAWMQSDPRLAALRPLLLVEAAMFGVVAVLGIATGVDLLRLRRWARVSVLIFGGFLGLMGFTAGFVILLMPFPTPPHPPAELARVMTGVRVGISAFYFLLLALGAWWLWLFTRESVKAQFAGGKPGLAAPAGGSPAAAAVARVGVAQGRPVSITIIAVLILLGAINFPVALLLRFPAYVFGWLVAGWGGAAFYLGFSLAHLAIGVGLLKLRPWSRWAAIALYLFGMINAATMALPGRMEALMEVAWSRFPMPMRPPASFPMPPMWIYMAPGLVLIGVILYFLVREGKAFGKRVPSTE
ncbi:MAG TPA: hypothetical protein VLT85_11130 [Terriglobales bacterium]|nr:hypothetical protein [Terriglobales bacterium]